jgi:hypothetical protein
VLFKCVTTKHKQFEGVEKRFAVCVFLPLAALWLKHNAHFSRDDIAHFEAA